MQSTGYQYKGGLWGEQTLKDGEEQGVRNVAIVTTTNLPWMIGTAINPLFCATYLAKNRKKVVTLLIPWLCKDDRGLLYQHNMCFDSPEEQEAYIFSTSLRQEYLDSNLISSWFPTHNFVSLTGLIATHIFVLSQFLGLVIFLSSK